MTWQVRQTLGGAGWWVTDGPWEPGHPESIVAKTDRKGVADGIAAEHNRRSGRMGGKCFKCGAVQPQTFSQLVNGWRGDRTLRDAGEASGVHGSTLSRVENGELPDLRTYIKLVDATGADPEFALFLVRNQLPGVPEKPAGEDPRIEQVGA